MRLSTCTLMVRKMAIDTNSEVNGSWLYKWIRADRLAEVLKLLPGDAELVPNGVGNLSVYVPDGDKFAYYGYIDISGESLEKTE